MKDNNNNNNNNNNNVSDYNVTNIAIDVEAEQLADWLMPLLAYFSISNISIERIPFDIVSYVETYITSTLESEIFPNEKDFMYSGLVDYELERADELKEIKRLGRINYINNGVEYKKNPKEWVAAFSKALSDNINQSNNIKIDLVNNCFIVNYDKQFLKKYVENFEPRLLELLKKMCIFISTDYFTKSLVEEIREKNKKTSFYR